MVTLTSLSPTQPQPKPSPEAETQTNERQNAQINQPLLNNSKSKMTSFLFRPPWKRAFVILFIVVSIGMASAVYSGYSYDPMTIETQVENTVGFTQSFDGDIDKLIDLSIRMKRKIIQSSSLTEQTFPMLVSLAVKDLMLSYRAPLDLVCVLDHSGSMHGEKMELVKNTFKYLLHFLNDFDRLSIVIFDDQVSTIVPLTNTTDANKRKILSAISTVQDRGGTNINLGVQRALEILKERKDVNAVTSIFLLSDGLDNFPGTQERIKDTLTNSGLQDDVIIHTFGFGRDHDPQLMTDIADITDGSFYFINQLDNIDEAFVECLGGLQSSIADSVQITVRPEQSEFLQGVEIIKAYGDATMWMQKGQEYTTKTTNLMHGRQKDYVLELKIPTLRTPLHSGQTNVKIASVEAVINLPEGRQIVKSADLIITLLNEAEEFRNNEEDDREVMKNYYRVRGALLMDQARRMSDEGKYLEAKKMLEIFKEEVGNSFLKEEGFIKDMIKDLEKSIQYVEPAAYHEYGRHNLIGNQRAQMRQKSNLDLSAQVKNTYVDNMLVVLAEL